MKDRIRQIMESQHMTQQTFSQFIGMSAGSLSSIFTGRTKPTINIIEAIKNKIPGISTDWLMFGNGSMYVEDQSVSTQKHENQDSISPDPILDFSSSPLSPTPSIFDAANNNAVNNTLNNTEKTVVKIVDKPQRKITEIRVFYDDQTWETFIPKK